MNKTYLIVSLVLITAFIFVQGSEPPIVNPPPPGPHQNDTGPGNLNQSVSLAIAGFYNYEGKPLAVISGQGGVKFLKFNFVVINRDTVPLNLNITEVTPNEFSVVFPKTTLTLNPGESKTLTSNLLDVSPFIGKTQLFSVKVIGVSPERVGVTKQASLSVKVDQDPVAQFDISISNEAENLPVEQSGFYNSYLITYTDSSGYIKSNHLPLSWCPNSCIGCDGDVTSEGIARLMDYAVSIGDKKILDQEIDYYYNTMKHPVTNHMMWKLNADGSPGSCGGVNSAVDAELIAIDALIEASKKWSTDSGGRSYSQTARLLMDSMKPGIIDGKYLPYCMYVQGTETRPCERKVFLGYVNLMVLNKMCNIDAFWCSVYSNSKTLMNNAIQNNGVYSAYNVDTQQFTYENAPIHPNWVIKHLAIDGTTTKYQPFYDQSRSIFMGNKQICQEFQPGSGCKQGNPATWVYSEYLEMAKAKGDTQFENALAAYINEKVDSGQYSPIAAADNFGNIVVLQALGR